MDNTPSLETKGQALREAIFILLEKNTTSSLPVDEFVQLYLNLHTLYSNPNFEDSWILANNMTYREGDIAFELIFRDEDNAHISFCCDLMQSSDFVKELFSGIQLWRIHVVPEIIRMLEEEEEEEDEEEEDDDNNDPNEWCRALVLENFVVSFCFLAKWCENNSDLMDEYWNGFVSKDVREEVMFWRNKRDELRMRSREYELTD